MKKKHAADYSFKKLPTVRITRCGHQSNNQIIISSSPTADSALGIFRNPDPDLCVQDSEFITGCSECLSFPHCQYTARRDFDTFPEVLLSANIGNYDCEKGLLFWLSAKHGLHTNILQKSCLNLSLVLYTLRWYNLAQPRIATDAVGDGTV